MAGWLDSRDLAFAKAGCDDAWRKCRRAALSAERGADF
jgi:hypothetical protein